VKGRVLVAGFATRHVAQSASAAGYEVCAVDHFCDQDLAWYTKDRVQFDELDELPDAVDRISRKHVFDLLVVTSGAEDLGTAIPLLGTHPERIHRFLDKLDMQHFFEGLDFTVPRLAGTREYPVMIKPRCGAGGWRNEVVRSRAAEDDWVTRNPGIAYLRQQVIEGVPASVCCVTDGTTSRALAANEQLLRGGGNSAFGFCGSITPLDHPVSGSMMAIAEKIASASGCIGTIGIDFVISGNTPYAIEVNPRFQGTVDTVEAAYAYNLFAVHADACRGNLPVRRRPVRYAARSILFADRDMVLAADLQGLAPVVADIPWPGTFFEDGQAIVSVFGSGNSRNEALSVLDKNIMTVRQYMQ
jgi:hypothetical protein